MPANLARDVTGPPWTIDPARAALLVHDMQNHHVRAFPPDCSPVVELVANIATLRELAGTLDMPIVFSAEPAAQRPGRRGLMSDVWGPGIGPEPDGDAGVVAADAFMHDIQPFVVADAVAGFSAEDHSMALRWIARTGVVCTTDQLIRHLLHGKAAHSM
jgi:isochorismate hydrolase